MGLKSISHIASPFLLSCKENIKEGGKVEWEAFIHLILSRYSSPCFPYFSLFSLLFYCNLQSRGFQIQLIVTSKGDVNILYDQLHHTKDFEDRIFSLTATVIRDLIYKNPSCFSIGDADELPRAFLDLVMVGVLRSAETITSIPRCLDRRLVFE